MILTPRRAFLLLALALAPQQLHAGTRPAVAETERVVTVRRGDTLAQILSGAGVEASEAHAALAELAPAFPPRSLSIGQEVGLRLDRRNRLLSLEIEAAPGRNLVLRRTVEGFAVEEHETPQQRHLARIEAPIRGGVFPTLTRAGLPGPLAHGLIRALSHEVDFQRDIQPGDRIAVAFERIRAQDGDLIGHGQVLHAAITLSGRVVEIWRYRDPEGESEWYDASGAPIEAGFLRTPLDGARVTSGFGMRRHPILGFSRKHEGVDFAAPSGTPVYAAGDGVVLSLTTERGYGRIVRIRHPNNIETRYAHLSRFASGLKVGERVRQGDVIGHVGSTGMATGPHLHYEIAIAGRPADPARTDLPNGAKLRGQALANFHAQRRALQRQIAQLANGLTEVALAR